MENFFSLKSLYYMLAGLPVFFYTVYMSRPYVAASSYLNAAPLCYSFIYGEQQDACEFLSDAAPARCADMLARKEADAALIPVIEYQRIAGLKVAPGACVASRGNVRSVILASRLPIEEVRSVALDTSSRTSAALIQIILSRFYGLTPSYHPSPPRIEEMLELNDAALIIGDPAMLIDRSALHVYDMAAEWRKHTGLPFVFAFWAIREDSQTWPGKVDFLAARREGLAHAEYLADLYAASLGLPREDLIAYLTENISYDLDKECLRGLDLYYDLARECGLIEEKRELVFMRDA
ncbi:MAG TPA: menaquinone biosynthesis protein [Blastocatellia bacterium]|nr:menaquinone biosynthesis protein [Blastocatellia bacterium]